MPGLLSDVLPFLYSQGDRAKRYARGLLSDPVGVLEQAMGQVSDSGRENRGLLNRAISDRGDYDSKEAQQFAEKALTGVLGFAPAGVVYPRAEALEAARKNAVKMLGLPENNTAADRALAMGFADDVYHGTKGDVPAFDLAKVKANYPYSFGVHTTSRPSEASIYADKLENGMRNHAEGWNPASKFSAPVADGGNVIPLVSRPGKQLVRQTDGLTASMDADLNRSEIIRELLAAKNSGKPYDSVLIQRAKGDEYDGSNFIAMNPSVLRSRFAAFDPARVGEADLLASIILGTIGLGAMLPPSSD